MVVSTNSQVFDQLKSCGSSNPLHIDVFQNVVRFESEVVAMPAASLLGK